MRLSQLFTKTQKNAPADAVSVNAQFLERGGFVHKNSAGVYSYLPLGWRVMQKIVAIIRQEMDAIGGQEMLMPTLIEKKYMELTNRWNLDVGFFTKDSENKEANFVLGWSHEEVLTALAAHHISSYKDLPFAAYQIQTKFRNEPRAKSGILRGKEFLMKDLYSFHASEQDLLKYYETVKNAYLKVFERCGLRAIYTLAPGGVFTKNFTHEFQVVSDIGEDTILACSACEYAENVEITKLKAGEKCPKCGEKITEKKSIEVGNIFNDGTAYSEPMGLFFTDEQGNKNPVWMAAYGIGVSRVMGTIAETHHDERGIVWPETVAPFQVHLIKVVGHESSAASEAEKIYNMLVERGVEVLYDDRDEKTAGEKFADADLLGIPLRVVVSEKTLKENKIEVKKRNEDAPKLISFDELFQMPYLKP